MYIRAYIIYIIFAPCAVAVVLSLVLSLLSLVLSLVLPPGSSRVRGNIEILYICVYALCNSSKITVFFARAGFFFIKCTHLSAHKPMPWVKNHRFLPPGAQFWRELQRKTRSNTIALICLLYIFCRFAISNNIFYQIFYILFG